MSYIIGDIHDVIKTLDDNSIDCVYTNPPFGTTENEWDKSLDWSTLWTDIWRVIKPNGAIILHSAMPFTYDLIRHSPVNPRYHYIWVKNNSTNFFHAKRQPLRKHEEILVFYKKQPTYNPQMVGDEIFKTGAAVNNSSYYGKRNHKVKDSSHKGRYPTTVLEYPINVRGGKTTPDELIEFFIKTYTNEGDLVLDMTCHNTVVGDLVVNLNRNYLGVDLDLK